jgi:RNA polymerase sigma-70 factor (ECF subfamily)
MDMVEQDSHAPGSFPTTRWSAVDRAARLGGEGQREALGQLLRRYLPALKAHMMRKMGLSADHADDLLQEFVSDKVLEQRILAQADQARGRFRTFLLTAFQNYVISVFRRERARKRSPGHAGALSVEEDPDLIAVEPPNTDVYDVEWARQVLAETLRRMQARCEASGREDLWRLFQLRFAKPILEQADPAPYEDIIREFGFRSPLDVSNSMTTAKRMFARHLRSVVGEYCADQEEVEEEIRGLMEILLAARA